MPTLNSGGGVGTPATTGRGLVRYGTSQAAAPASISASIKPTAMRAREGPGFPRALGIEPNGGKTQPCQREQDSEAQDRATGQWPDPARQRSDHEGNRDPEQGDDRKQVAADDQRICAAVAKQGPVGDV